MKQTHFFKYLIQYAKIFDISNEKPISMWSVISWLLKDYELSKIRNIPEDIHLHKNFKGAKRVDPNDASKKPLFQMR